MADNNDDIIVYLNARKEFEAARAAVTQAGAFLSEVGGALQRRPDRVQFAGFAQGLPSAVSASPETTTFDPNQLRSPPEITAALVRYHDARRRTHEAWSFLSADKKQGLLPPPEDPPRR